LRGNTIHGHVALSSRGPGKQQIDAAPIVGVKLLNGNGQGDGGRLASSASIWFAAGGERS
jgi:hypothetical protein